MTTSSNSGDVSRSSGAKASPKAGNPPEKTEKAAKSAVKRGTPEPQKTSARSDEIFSDAASKAIAARNMAGRIKKDPFRDLNPHHLKNPHVLSHLTVAAKTYSRGQTRFNEDSPQADLLEAGFENPSLMESVLRQAFQS